jgi:hypothetical protein
MQHVFHAHHIIIVQAEQQFNAGKIIREIVQALDAAHESV